MKGYTTESHRSVLPEVTLRAAEQVAAALGVTRCADITGLDDIGIPVYCAIRPHGRVLQTANGKGSRHIEAKLSALMEAIEHACVEEPPEPSVSASVADLRNRGLLFADPQTLQGFDRSVLYHEERTLPWVEGSSLPSENPILVPGPFVYPMEPIIYRWSTNGLASGNNLLEATLHALYEICERHSLSLLAENGQIQLGGCQVIDCRSIDDATVARLLSLTERARCRLLLLRVDLDWKLHTFLAVLLDPSPERGPSMVNLGHGAHLSHAVAAIRAITEAAQSRLTFIHGAREDLPSRAFEERHSRLYKKFEQTVPDTSWTTLHDNSTGDLAADYQTLLTELEAYGFDGLLRVRLPSPSEYIAVVKVAIFGTEMRFPL